MEFWDFKRRYTDLNAAAKDELQRHVYKEFAGVAWSREGKKFNRPEWALSNFFVKHKIQSGRLLDVAPAHGHHGALIFKERLPQMSVETCDLLPCYTKLLTLYGLNVEHYNARFDRLDDVYGAQHFDAVTCTEVLEHVDDNAEGNILAGLASIVRPAGFALFTFPVHAITQKVPDPMGHIRQPDTQQVAARCAANFDFVEDGEFNSGKTYQRFLIVRRKT
jgi:2-polyprenyl-3-methyl-5-hydroxy-6-metoxy-1,4-benzoquinol methylase